MKSITTLITGFLMMASVSVRAESDDQLLLEQFHKYEITKCDKAILKNSRLEGNWNFFISKHKNNIDPSVKEASGVQITGTENDTIRVDVSYIQSKNGCFVHTRSTVTHPGSCSENVDMNSWYVSEDMPGKDYTKYTNKGGVDMFAKDIRVGNFRACIQEYTRRNFEPLS